MSFSRVDVERSKSDCSKIKVTLIDGMGKHRVYARESVASQNVYDSKELENGTNEVTLSNIPTQSIRLVVGVVDRTNGDQIEDAYDFICGDGVTSLFLGHI